MKVSNVKWFFLSVTVYDIHMLNWKKLFLHHMVKGGAQNEGVKRQVVLLVCYCL